MNGNAHLIHFNLWATQEGKAITTRGRGWLDSREKQSTPNTKKPDEAWDRCRDVFFFTQNCLVSGDILITPTVVERPYVCAYAYLCVCGCLWTPDL